MLTVRVAAERLSPDRMPVAPLVAIEATMTAAEILDQLLEELGDMECPTRTHLGYKKHAKRCRACLILDQVVDIVIKAEGERDRARIIFGEAA